MLEKSLKKYFFKLINLYLFFLRTSASGETGSPRLFTYHEIWPSAIINDLTILLFKKKTASIATGSIIYRRYWLSARYVLYISTEITLGYSVSMHSLALTSPCLLAVRLGPLQD